MTVTTTLTAPTAHDAAPASALGAHLGRTGAAAGAAASLATFAIAGLARALDISLSISGKAIPVAGFPQLTFAGAIIGTILAVALSRRAAQPRRTFVTTTVVLTALSIVPDMIVERPGDHQGHAGADAPRGRRDRDPRTGIAPRRLTVLRTDLPSNADDSPASPKGSPHDAVPPLRVAQPSNPVPDDPEVMQKAFEQVDAFNAELQASGAWVFAGGLHAPETATVVRAEGGEADHHRRPVRRDQGTARRLLDHRRRPISTPRSVWAAKGSAACMGPVEVRPFQRRAPDCLSRTCPTSSSPDLERIFREESGRVVATLVRLFGDIDIAEEMVQEAFLVASERWPVTGAPAEPRRLDHHHRSQPRDRPAAS